MGTGHGHGTLTAAGKHRGRLIGVLAITASIMVVQVIGALLSGSIALLADAGHMLTDSAGVALALVAITLAARPPTAKRTFGLARAEILAAAANAAVLLGLGAYILYESVMRLSEPPNLQTGSMLIFGIIGLVGNVVSMLLLFKAQNDSLNMRGAFLEVATDTLASVGVIAAALIARFTGFTRADAIVAILIGLLILPRAFSLLRASVDVLLEAAPKNVDLEEVRQHILGVPHVRDVHDLHAWTVTSGMPVLSAHIVVEDECFHDGHAPQVLDELQTCLAGHFDVEHSTFQLEPASHSAHEHAAHP
ncbi:cation diffusion facilitator family transporter [Lentzea sp. BCCO 10_0061]|uniref:Cation diffusion facilitator family transporter n=1 Tax=Lentzea sokolovensis TaxID=3095429 RepID=A0ABU4UVZ7_9PSEU|nr:cation diffusion facilitator family transporter [Lentzea sp. BCCO 10_0061]MDX8143179.1 cation diffusion facilitator family transporter [Lentzea sp. BCCO 10_0061]